MSRALAAAVLVTVALLVVAMVALGAEPSSAPTAVFEGGDPRSDGAGPGLVGNPLLILAAVVGLGLATAALTALLMWVGRRD